MSKFRTVLTRFRQGSDSTFSEGFRDVFTTGSVTGFRYPSGTVVRTPKGRKGSDNTASAVTAKFNGDSLPEAFRKHVAKRLRGETFFRRKHEVVSHSVSH